MKLRSEDLHLFLQSIQYNPSGLDVYSFLKNGE